MGGLTARSPLGGASVTTSWQTFIVYDQELRNLAFKLVNGRGSTIKEALVAARQDNELRTKFLVTPLALSHLSAPPPIPAGNVGKRAAADADDWHAHEEHVGKRPPNKKQKTGEQKAGKKGDKGKSKGKSQGKGKQPKTRFAPLRNSGKLKFGAEGSCWDYNRPGGCGKGNTCDFAHTCAFCGGRHSVEDCDSYTAAMGST